ncbi:ALPHA-MANNOSIDASE domain protein [Mycobacterium xenopi 3993]|nr:ALPHA-MANNOSIDASE domain protein [Mycobacterium xenopi 3993]
MSSWVHDGRELIAEGRVGNELALYEEYPSHPSAGEGPWHLLSKGPVVCSSSEASEVRAYHGRSGSGWSSAAASARCCATRRR